MNLSFIKIACLFLIGGILLFYFSDKQRRKLEENYTMIGVLAKYKKIGKFFIPVIEFIENGEKKVITRPGKARYRPIVEGEEVKILKKANGSYLTDYDVRRIRYSAGLMLIAAFALICGFVLELFN